jgi:PPM family protein phosphatase
MEKLAPVHLRGISDCLYRLMLQTYPRSFRDEYATEMLLVFRDAQADASGGWRLLRLWRDVIGDFTASLCVQWTCYWMSGITNAAPTRTGKEQLVMTLPFILNVAQQTDIGRTRTSNEDNLIVVMPQSHHLLQSRGALFVVSDGMGGHSNGEIASQLAVQTVNDTYYEDVDKDIPTALKDALTQANEIILQAGADHDAHAADEASMGATCVAAVLHEHTLYAANVGDSRVYVMHDGLLRQITRDHSLVAQMVERGELTAEEARTHEQRNIIYRALGQAEVEIDLFTEPVADGDIVILCTDGLSGVVPEDDVQAIVEQYPPNECVERLIACANDAGGPDNVTAIVVRVSAGEAR